jgi:hypothetical protein
LDSLSSRRFGAYYNELGGPNGRRGMSNYSALADLLEPAIGWLLRSTRQLAVSFVQLIRRLAHNRFR